MRLLITCVPSSVGVEGHTSTVAIPPTSTLSELPTITSHTSTTALHPTFTMVLYSSTSITSSQLPTISAHTGTIVLRPTSTPITPTHLPTITSHSNELIVVGVVLIVLVCGVIVVLGVGVWRWRRGKMQVNRCEGRVEAINRTSAEDSMEYNPMYRPQNQQESKPSVRQPRGCSTSR